MIVLYYLHYARKRREPIGHILAEALGYALVAVSSHLIILFTDSYFLISVAYSVYFVCLDWMLYCLLTYATEYTGHRIKYLLGKRSAGMLLGLDSLSLILNPFFEHAAGYEEYYVNQDLYLQIQPHIPYTIHLIICYCMCASIFSVLLWKTIHSPKLYKKRYGSILGCFCVTIVLNAVFMLTSMKIDVSILFYALGAVLLYNYTFIIAPKKLIEQTLGMVSERMNEAFLIWDMDGVCIYSNKKALEIFRTIGTFQEFCSQLNLPIREEERGMNIPQFSYHGNGKDYILEIQYESLVDEKERRIASFFVVDDVTDQVRRIQNQKYLATHDVLTGLYNKLYFFEIVSRVLSENQNRSYLMICSDVSKFKLINDTFGNQTGSQVLCSIANTVSQRAPEGSVYCRLESDKFALFMEKKYYTEEVFLESTQEMFRIGGNMLPIQIYYGVYEIRDRTIPVDLMCDRAIMALNTIKGTYQKQFGYYNEELRDSMLEEQEMMAEVRHALQEEQFEIYLQPQINPRTNEITGAEALIRWKHPGKGMISPGKFIPVFEKNGMIEQVDRYIWEQACRLLSRWKAEGHGERSVSVNISPKDFYFSDIYQILTDLVKKYDISPQNLKLEITESAIMIDVQKQIELMEMLKSAGFVIEMDDFGSGYSSLNTLKDIPADVLKLDMAFVRETQNLERSTSIVHSVIEMAHKLNMIVIAEGVEEKEQVDYLQEMGCDVIQGYYYARPMPVSEYEQMLMAGI